MRTVIFDLDGTLADLTHRLHHIKGEKKNWDAFHAECVNDSLKRDVASVYRAMKDAEYYMVICSGRSDVVREETEAWLDKHGLTPNMLLMRRKGDYTPDDDLKRQWLQSGKLGCAEHIVCVFDDRQRVVDMWRSEGLTCLQVEAWKEE
jgi:phosphoglycolate phosphatase-like HAD superfamily hydrolase